MSCPCRIQKKLIHSRYMHDIQKEVYLDYNATTAPDRELLALYQNLALHTWGNPLSPHGAGSAAYELGESARKIIRKSLQSKEHSLLFFSSGTEAIFKGLQLFRIQSARIGDFHVFPSAVCHPSVFNALEILEFPYTTVPVDTEGKMKLEDLKIEERPLFIYSPVNHETGGLEDCGKIRRFADRHRGMIFADGVQAFVRRNEEEWLPFCDLYSISGHKFHVPRGISLLGVHPGAANLLRAEDYKESSADSILQYILAKGMEKVLTMREELNRQLSIQEKDAHYLWRRMDLSYTVESPALKAPGILNISLPCIDDMEKFFVFLARKNICVSRFCACSGTVEGESSILSLMGVPSDRSRRSLRLSAGKHTVRQDWIILGRAIKEFIQPV